MRWSCGLFFSLSICLCCGLYLSIFVCWAISVSLAWSWIDHGAWSFWCVLWLCVRVFCLYLCPCTIYIQYLGGQREEPNTFETGVRDSHEHHVGAGNHTYVWAMIHREDACSPGRHVATLSSYLFCILLISPTPHATSLYCLLLFSSHGRSCSFAPSPPHPSWSVMDVGWSVSRQHWAFIKALGSTFSFSRVFWLESKKMNMVLQAECYNGSAWAQIGSKWDHT